MNLTTEEAAARLGVSRRRVQQFILEGRLRATRLGRDYIVTEAEADRFARLTRPAHRPAAAEA